MWVAQDRDSPTMIRNNFANTSRRKKNRVVRRGMQSNGNKFGDGPSPSAVIYQGPITRRGESQGLDTNTQTFLSDSAVASSVGTTLSAVWGGDPTGSGGFNNPASPEWAAYVALYREYRVLGLQVEFIPNAQYSQPTAAGLTFAPLYEVVEHDGTTANLTGYSQATQFPSMIPRSLTKPWKRAIRMADTLEAAFIATANAPTVPLVIKWFSTALSASAPYGRARVSVLVQLRGRV